MTHRPPSTLGVLWLLAGIAIKQLLRAARIHKLKRKPPREGEAVARRAPTARKPKDGLAWLMVLMVPLFLFQATVMTGLTVGRFARDVAQHVDAAAVARAFADQPLAGDDDHGATRHLGGGARHRDLGLLARNQRFDPEKRAVFLGGASLLLTVLLVALLAIAFGGANASLAGGRWTQAWLMTFPVSTRALVLAKTLEYGLVTLFPWLTLFPLTWQLLRALGQPGALPIAIVATLASTLLLGAVRLWGETWLRLRFRLEVLRSVQGGCTLLSLMALALLFTVGLGENTPRWFLDVAAAVPSWVAFTPGSWPLLLGEFGASAALVGLIGSALVVVVAVAMSARLLRHGAMQSGGVDAGARGRAGGWRRTRRLGVIGKDLLLLARDRNFLVQALVLPVFVIGMNLFVNRGFERAAGRGVVLIAYGAGAFAVTRSCFQVLGAEGRALWMLWALPVTLGEVVRRKLRIWSCVGLGFSVVALVAFALRDAAPISWPRMSWDFLLAGFGVVCAAHIGGSIGMLSGIGADGQLDRQPKQRHAWLYMFFTGTYCIGLGSAEPAVQIAGALVFATLAYALWQRAVDRLPWLLDPIEEPKRLLSLFDGATAVLVFFLLQALVALVMVRVGDGDAGLSANALLLAFVIAGLGALLFTMVSLAGRDLDIAEHLRLRPKSGRRAFGAVLLGAAAGAGMGLLGLGYVHWLRSSGENAWFVLPPAEAPDLAIVLLAVVAAPVVEELLFRGLVFGGLVRSVRPWLAVLWSAGLFATVHPMHSWLPVGLVGVVAAVVVHRTAFLPAAMVLHAVYNGIVIGIG